GSRQGNVNSVNTNGPELGPQVSVEIGRQRIHLMPSVFKVMYELGTEIHEREGLVSKHKYTHCSLSYLLLGLAIYTRAVDDSNWRRSSIYLVLNSVIAQPSSPGFTVSP